MTVWSLAEIVAYCEVWRIDVTVKDGSPSAYSHAHADKLRQLIPHLKHKRAELIEYFSNPHGDHLLQVVRPRAGAKVRPDAEVERLRRLMVCEVLARANAMVPACGVWLLMKDGAIVAKGLPVPRDATHVCVQSDDQWIALAKFAPEVVAHAPRTFKFRKYD